MIDIYYNEIIFKDNKKMRWSGSLDNLIYFTMRYDLKNKIKCINITNTANWSLNKLLNMVEDYIENMNFSYLYIKIDYYNIRLYCKNINEFENIYDNIYSLYLYNCNLENLPKNICDNIYRLHLYNSYIEKLPNLNLNSLEYLTIHNSNIKLLPHNLNNLLELDLYKCNNLRYIPYYLQSIKLNINDCLFLNE